MGCKQNFGGCGGATYGTCAPSNCPDRFGCVPGVCPDFVIRRHDTVPAFKVNVEDCDGPMDLTDLVVEASMWAKAKLKTAINTSAVYLSFADRIGFEQVMVGDIIVMDRVRMPEHMKVIGFDEANYQVMVERGANGTTPSAWAKGTPLRIMKMFSAPAASELVYEDRQELDGTVTKQVLTNSFLVYEWKPADTCLPGCYWLEFKLLKLLEEPVDPEPSSDTTLTLSPADYGCKLGTGVEWVRRFPVSGEGYLIKIENSPTAEL